MKLLNFIIRQTRNVNLQLIKKIKREQQHLRVL